MQDPASSTMFQKLNPPVGMAMVQLPEQKQQLKCPRCESSNTKFCYYNNYNLSQPRHYCKSCRRYWTKGGTLRNIPVGGGSRKNPSSSSSSNPSDSNINASSLSGSKRGNPDQIPDLARPARRASGSGHDPSRVPAPESGAGLSFSSLMSSGGQFGAIFDRPGRIPGGGLVEDLNSGLGLRPIWRAEDGGDDGGGGWPDLAIYTPGSTNSFH